jgi:hypothetical protein
MAGRKQTFLNHGPFRHAILLVRYLNPGIHDQLVIAQETKTDKNGVTREKPKTEGKLT